MSTKQVVPHYAMHSAWSDEDGAYLVTLPEWMPRFVKRTAVTHGATYDEEPARNGQEALDMLIAHVGARRESSPVCESEPGLKGRG